MFKQFYEDDTSTLTYLIADDDSKEAVFIDPVNSQLSVYLEVLKTHGLTLKYTLETHVHADHVTAGGLLKQHLNSQTAVSQQCGAENADLQLKDGTQIQLGKETITVISTPGHTAGSVSFLWQDRVFTGDSLLINGCGRTDFQSGNAGLLYDVITQRIFTLPDETLVYPGHDYNNKRVSCVGQEKIANPRLAGKTKEEFVEMMNNLNLPKPKYIDIAVPANLVCGVPDEVPQG